jgi:DNA polymerase-3 subunit epsilon
VEIITPLINKRLELLKFIEPKESIKDVVFTLNCQNNRAVNSNIYLIPSEGNLNALEKNEAINNIVEKINNKSFFKENLIDINQFNLAVLFTFDTFNLVDNCYIFDFSNNSISFIVFTLEGKLLICKNIEISNKSISVIDQNKSSSYYLFFDTETTGLPKNWKAPVTELNNWPRLVQIAYILCDENTNAILAEDFIIKPHGFNIPIEASKIHGITTERANKEGKPISLVLQKFNNLVNQSNYLVAHNMSFDEKIIGAEFLRNGMHNSIAAKRKICTMESSTNYCAIKASYGYKWPNLSELYYKLFKTNFNEAHNAAIDIKATARCFWELKRRKIL